MRPTWLALTHGLSHHHAKPIAHDDDDAQQAAPHASRRVITCVRQPDWFNVSPSGATDIARSALFSCMHGQSCLTSACQPQLVHRQAASPRPGHPAQPVKCAARAQQLPCGDAAAIHIFYLQLPACCAIHSLQAYCGDNVLTPVVRAVRGESSANCRLTARQGQHDMHYPGYQLKHTPWVHLHGSLVCF